MSLILSAGDLYPWAPPPTAVVLVPLPQWGVMLWSQLHTHLYFRPHPGTKFRPVFDWAHWFVGNSAFILGNEEQPAAA